ncbi:cytochrome C biosynthesis protein [Rhodonellum psychrophilum GCM71 = DSM 17998]|uniref:Cytochrome C biosynthesis protein n=2 Tax=Rhodonellum TaxID=336827 RepID=U5C765_9BACT|nr:MULTISPECIES: tetratricopeptide repeat protein [Rhodonellum]ERM84047.1 cytochrome C biosynthesis protein [Rhodonellum psychrophilum GCM71 = DSM 17998]MDO9552729.1 tetratricopeptide repeat protein [Rhodonellum sp.]SDY40444.1 Tetratricopeptide repeat-containing protein [Rhodonellum ikkaensis]
MTKKHTTKAQDEQANELLENPEVIAERLNRGETFIKKNSKIFGGILIAGILVIAGVLFYQINKQNQNKKAQAEMFQAVYYFEQDSTDLALNGDGSNPGFLKIVDQYSGTAAANLSHFYIGAIYLSEGKFKESIDHMKKFSADDYFVQARAYALLGDANLELGNTKEAISFYKKAADEKENKYFTPRYLSKLAIAYEEAGDFDNAVKTYSIIEDKYFESFEFTAARKHKARLEGLASK